MSQVARQMQSNLGDFYALCAAICWSSAVIFFRKAGRDLAALPLNVFKSTLSVGVFLVVVVLAAPTLVPDWPGDYWLRLALSGLLGVTVGDLLFLMALNRLGASFVAIVDCSYTVFAFLTAYALFGEVPSLFAYLGGALVVGAVLIASVAGKELAHADRGTVTVGVLCGLGAQVSMVYGLLMVRDIFRAESLVHVTAWRFLVGASALWLVALLGGQGARTIAAFRPSATLRYALPGVVLGPVIATFFWFAGFKYTLASRAAIYNQTGTIMIVVMAAIFLGERLTVRKSLAVGLAVIGALVVSLGETVVNLLRNTL